MRQITVVYAVIPWPEQQYAWGVPIYHYDPWKENRKLIASFKTNKEAVIYIEKQMELNPYAELFAFQKTLKGDNKNEKLNDGISDYGTTYNINGTIELRKAYNKQGNSSRKATKSQDL